MHTGAIKKGQNVLLIDDLIATGGTLAAGVTLVEQVRLLLLTCCFHAICRDECMSLQLAHHLAFCTDPWLLLQLCAQSLKCTVFMRWLALHSNSGLEIHSRATVCWKRTLWWLQVGAKVVECAVVIELKDLNGKAKLGGLPLYVQVQKEGGPLF